MKILRLKHFSMVMVCTLWLSAEDYPVLLGMFLTTPTFVKQ